MTTATVTIVYYGTVAVRPHTWLRALNYSCALLLILANSYAFMRAHSVATSRIPYKIGPLCVWLLWYTAGTFKFQIRFWFLQDSIQALKATAAILIIITQWIWVLRHAMQQGVLAFWQLIHILWKNLVKVFLNKGSEQISSAIESGCHPAIHVYWLVILAVSMSGSARDSRKIMIIIGN